ncbi:hypothetical protein WR25_22536 isoform D [Diploscapter pachys]|uniref:Major facilitator superfamily (MFS) profile domain-containing protein n=2 Tax=Diploscapter pachys TaxID=2018661 RepID=A0A2A2JXS1_9BILA|nr:hypothetical protein WR25_22536 isoform B [Diploscapter pachys]PAV66519.1 hypothetical protein WR25_22536 isoform D [Diploscapter pachys]
MYTIPAFLMVILSFVACAVTLTSFTVNYAGIMDDEDSDPSKIVPKYDLLPAIVCIYLFVSCCMIGTNIEVISTPVSTVMYDWKDSKSILLNGIFESLGCVVSLVGNVAIGYTRIGKIDKRLQILFGLSLFLLYHIFNYPWSFYSGPLHFLPPGENTTIDHGGCLPSYTWCNDTVRVPLPLYIFCFIFLYGFAFPFVGSPAGALFSEILGPIRQGWMQGMYSLGGSFAQFAAPILATYLFQNSGYKYVMVTQICTLSSASLLVSYPKMTIATGLPTSEKDPAIVGVSKDDDISISAESGSVEVVDVFHELKTPWPSVWFSIVMQFVVGVQIVIYYMSQFPYLQNMDPTADMDFMGWSNPLFGLWNQKTLSTVNPTIVGFIIAAIGQFMYAIIPVFPSHRKWWIMVARFITGNLAVLKAYAAQASLPQDRMRAVAFGTAGNVLGFSFGPAIQAFFTPMGEGGPKVLGVPLNMYSTPAFLMVILLLGSAITMKIFFKEDYVAVINKTDDDERKNDYVVIPKFDRISAMICIYLYICIRMISTNVEVLSTPLSTVMYDWKDSTSILYNGILECVTCLVSVTVNLLIGYTRLGRIDKRIQIIFGLFIFLLYHLFNYPWPFYPGPLHFIPNGANNTAEHGGCLPNYEWCEHTPRVPFALYIVVFILFYGIAFPCVESPTSALYSEVLGPRKQGFMQGVYTLGGSVAQFIAPIYATYLFQNTGYRYIIITQIATLGLAAILVSVFYRRLVALRLKTPKGKSLTYKFGVYYSL